MPGPEPSEEVSAAICPPRRNINKHFLLLRKCLGEPWALGQERKQTAGYLAQTSRRCGKATTASPEQGNHKQNAPLGKHKQSRMVWETQPRAWIQAPHGGENRGPFRFLGTTTLWLSFSSEAPVASATENTKLPAYKLGLKLVYFLTELSVKRLPEISPGNLKGSSPNNPIHILETEDFFFFKKLRNIVLYPHSFFRWVDTT